MVKVSEEPQRPAHFVQSLERGLSVITAFGADSTRLTLSDVARATGLSRAAARRFLLTLVDLGHVSFDGKHFELTPRVLTLGYAYLSGLSLPAVVEPHLEKLSQRTGESASLAVLDGHDIVYVARVPTSRIMTVSINVGTRFPAYATSMGRVLLAGLADEDLQTYVRTVELERLTSRTVRTTDALLETLEQVRRRGYALSDQELEDGLRSIAVPVRNRTGTVVAAVNVSTHASRHSRDGVRKALLPPLLEAQEHIEADLRLG
jgi:IclR family pca regulon transcriptional regulator